MPDEEKTTTDKKPKIVEPKIPINAFKSGSFLTGFYHTLKNKGISLEDRTLLEWEKLFNEHYK